MICLLNVTEPPPKTQAFLPPAKSVPILPHLDTVPAWNTVHIFITACASTSLSAGLNLSAIRISATAGHLKSEGRVARQV